MNKKGFTLVELLAVIVILAILAAAAFILIIPRIQTARRKNFVSEVSEAINSSRAYFLANQDSKAVSIEKLLNDSYLAVKGINDNYRGAAFNDDGNIFIIMTNGNYMTKGVINISDLKEDELIDVSNIKEDDLKGRVDLNIAIFALTKKFEKSGLTYGDAVKNKEYYDEIEEQTGVKIIKADYVMNNNDYVGFMKISSGYNTCNPKKYNQCCVYNSDVPLLTFSSNSPKTGADTCNKGAWGKPMQLRPGDIVYRP